MASQETTWQSGEEAGDALGPEAGQFASLDMAGLGQSALAVLMRAAGSPGEVAMAGLRFWSDLARIGPVAAARWLGAEAAPPVPVPADKRFADRSWSDKIGRAHV